MICATCKAGIALICVCIPVKATDIAGLLSFAQRAHVDLTVVGPEAPLELGIVDFFRENRRRIFGPTQAAARMERATACGMSIRPEAGGPTASATLDTPIDSAKRPVREIGTPIVVKASGLAAGKGVVVAHSIEEAERAIEMILGDRVFGDAGSEVLVEEFMEGEELSLFAITEGEFVVTMLPAQDHKRLLDDDVGQNTGGMGSYAPVSLGTPELIGEITERIFLPTLAELKKENSKFTGVLYAGLMLTSEGPKVVEFNCRFGDPETQAILPLMKSSLLELIDTVASGGLLKHAKPIEWNDAYAVTTVLAAAGYPDSPRAGDAIRLPAIPSGIKVFHAGTKRGPATGELLTSGGRVLSITGVAPSLEEAAECSREYAERVSFEGKQMRRDIGWRELERHARAT